MGQFDFDAITIGDVERFFSALAKTELDIQSGIMAKALGKGAPFGDIAVFTNFVKARTAFLDGLKAEAGHSKNALSEYDISKISTAQVQEFMRLVKDNEIRKTHALIMAFCVVEDGATGTHMDNELCGYTQFLAERSAFMDALLEISKN